MGLAEQLADHAVTRTFQPGDVIFKEGGPAESLLLVLRGQVAIIKNANSAAPLVLSYRNADEIIGEVGLLGEGKRTASVMAVTDVTLLEIAHDDFWQLYEERKTFRQTIISTLVERLLAADESRLRAAAAERELFDRLDSITGEKEQIAEVLRLRRETMRFIVHDLRNPLNLVMMALSMIENDPAYSDEADSRRFLAMASGGARRMLSMVESLLDVERLDLGDTTLSYSRIHLPDLIEAEVEQHQPLAWASGVTLEVEHRAAEPLPHILADRERIQRVLTNLIDNALKFTEPDKRVLITTNQVGDEIRFAVDDSGPGIPPRHRDQVFDRFAQLDSEAASSSRGFGLGLAYCRAAMEAHGGRIWVEDGENGEGARFVCALPVPAPTTVQDETQAASEDH